MRQDKEMGTIIAAQNVEEEGTSGDGNANTGGESGAGGIDAGESGGVQAGGEYGEALQQVHQTPDPVHGDQWRGQVQELLGETLWVFPHAGDGGGGGQRWTVRVPEDKGGGGERDKGAGKEGLKADHTW